MVKPSLDVIKEHFKISNRFLKSARLLKKDGDLRTATDRAYYAMFHAAEAALRMKGVTTKSHHGLISQFHQEYIKTGLVDPKLGAFLRKAFDMRQESDYEVYAEPDKKQVGELVERAHSFVKLLKQLLAKRES